MSIDTPKFKGYVAFGCGKHPRNAGGGTGYNLDCLDCQRQPALAWWEGQEPAQGPPSPAASEPSGYLESNLAIADEEVRRQREVIRELYDRLNVLPESLRQPDGYAYRYPCLWMDGEEGTVIRFETGGKEINGSKPVEAIPYFLGAAPAPSPVSAATQDLKAVAREIVDRIYEVQCPTPTPIVEEILNRAFAAPVSAADAKLQPIAWMVSRDSCDPPEFFTTEEQARKNACLGMVSAGVIPLYRAVPVSAESAAPASSPAPRAQSDKVKELLRACMVAVVRLALLRGNIELEPDTQTPEELAEDAAGACFGEGCCDEEPIREVAELLRRLAAPVSAEQGAGTEDRFKEFAVAGALLGCDRCRNALVPQEVSPQEFMAAIKLRHEQKLSTRLERGESAMSLVDAIVSRLIQGRMIASIDRGMAEMMIADDVESGMTAYARRMVSAADMAPAERGEETGGGQS